MIRVTAAATTESNDSPPIYIDILVDDKGSVVSKRAVFGFQGKLDRNSTQQCYPFVLYSDGTIDFGSGYDSVPNERRASTDLLTRLIQPNGLFEWVSNNYGTHHYRITDIVPLV